MKTCDYCGRENEQSAVTCRECGRPLPANTASAEPGPPAPWKRIAVLGGEVEAERLTLELKGLDIPHVLVSYHDSALDGLFQTKGWGHVEAAEENRAAILSCLKDLRRGAFDDGESAADGPG